MRQEVCQRGRIHSSAKLHSGSFFFLLYMYHAGAIFHVSKMGGGLRLDFALNISCNFLQEAQHLYIAFSFLCGYNSKINFASHLPLTCS
jgi:hypothetical protein